MEHGQNTDNLADTFALPKEGNAKRQGDEVETELPPFVEQMGAGKSSLQTSIPDQLQLGEAIASPGRYSLGVELLQCSHLTTKRNLIPIANQKLPPFPAVFT